MSTNSKKWVAEMIFSPYLRAHFYVIYKGITHSSFRIRKEIEMKKILVLFILLVILTTSTVPALAASGPNRVGVRHGPQPDNFSIVGTLTAIDNQARTLTVLVMAGNRLVRPYLGQELVVSTQESTRFLLRSEDGCMPITFEDLEVDQNVSIWGQKLPEAWQAQRVTVGPVLQKLLS